MSQKILDKMLFRAIGVIEDEWARKRLDSANQIITVTKKGLIEAFKEGYDKARSDTDPTVSELLKNNKTRNIFANAANAAMNNLEAHLNRNKTLSNLIEKSDGKIVFQQPRYIKSPFKKLKEGGRIYIQKTLKSNLEPAKFNQNIVRGHKNTAVGEARLEAALKVFELSPNFEGFVSSKEWHSASKNLFGTKYKPTIKFQSTKGRGYSLRDLKVLSDITLSVEASKYNPRGAQSRDWTNIRPILEEALLSWASKQDWYNMKGSLSIREEAEIAASNLVLKNISDYIKNKKVSVTGNTPLKIKRKRNQSKKLKQNSISSLTIGSTKKASTKTKRSKSSPGKNAQELLSLQNLLNQKIQRTLRKNMREPGLVNRTGRFASSVRITDISTTPKGFPSIGYTYDKTPYQIFEQGAGKRPWANEDRDPRKVIDRSIREIASEVLIGRFFTRRM